MNALAEGLWDSGCTHIILFGWFGFVVWGGFVARICAHHGARSYTRNYADHTRPRGPAAPGGQLCVQGLPGAGGLD